MNTSYKIGDTFAGCKLLSQCGRGAYGIVFLAQNPLGQHICIKIIENSDTSIRELNGLKHYTRVSENHPNILRVFHIGEFQTGFYYTMEVADNISDNPEQYIPATLGNMLRQGKVFSIEEAGQIISELLDGLETIHNAGLLHRDIKPDNIVFVNGKVKLSDPGLVTDATQKNSIVGTPGFIPPEVVYDGLPASKNSDLYALGKLYYCMVTGNPANEYPHLPDLMPFTVRRQIFPALVRMCNRNSSKRFSSAQEFKNIIPKHITPPNFLERTYISFRDWKNLNQEKYTFLLYSVIILFFISLIIAGVLCLHYCKKKNYQAKCQKETSNFLSTYNANKEVLDLQISTYLPLEYPKFKKLDTALTQSVNQKNWIN